MDHCKKCKLHFESSFLNQEKVIEHINQCYSKDISKSKKSFCEYCQVFVVDITKHNQTMKHTKNKSLLSQIKYINHDEKEWCCVNPENGFITKIANFNDYEKVIEQIKKNETHIYHTIDTFKIGTSKKKILGKHIEIIYKSNLFLENKIDYENIYYSNNVAEQILSTLQIPEINDVKLLFKDSKIPKYVSLDESKYSSYSLLNEKRNKIVDFYNYFRTDFSVHKCHLIYNWKQNAIFENNFHLEKLTSNSIERRYVFHGFYKPENFQNILHDGFIESNNLESFSHLLLGKGSYFADDPKYSIGNGFCSIKSIEENKIILELLVCEIMYDSKLISSNQKNKIQPVLSNSNHSIFCVRNNIHQQVVAKLDILIEKQYPKLIETIVLPELDENLLEQNNNKNYFIKLSKDENEICNICLENNANIKLSNCKGKHCFHKKCINKWFKTKEICPVCKEFYGEKVIGTLPNGTMEIIEEDFSLPGFPINTDFGKAHATTYHIIYTIKDGIQLSVHDNPGKPFKGDIRHAYLPNSPDGRDCLILLKKAFEQRLTFIIGESLTTKRKDTICWNIHHKTSIQKNNPYGYPDFTYRTRLFTELEQYNISL